MSNLFWWLCYPMLMFAWGVYVGRNMKKSIKLKKGAKPWEGKM